MAEAITERWRLLPYDLGPSARHFALSDALVRHATIPSIWAHSTVQPTLILGAGQQDRAVDPEAVRRLDARIVRRQAGGTSVYAGPGVLGLDVFVPAAHPLALPDVVEAYRCIGEVWTAVMQVLGIPARMLSVQEARNAPRGVPEVEEVVRLACFGSLSPYEVVVDGRKLVGLAQVRRRNGVLWQSGVHTRFEYEPLAALLAPGQADDMARELRSCAIGLDELLDEPPDLETLARLFGETLAGLLGIMLVPGDWTALELAETGRGHS